MAKFARAYATQTGNAHDALDKARPAKQAVGECAGGRPLGLRAGAEALILRHPERSRPLIEVGGAAKSRDLLLSPRQQNRSLHYASLREAPVGMTVFLINDRPNVPTGEEDFSEEEAMPLLYTKQGHTGILTLSRPEARNCWGQDYAEGLIRHLDAAAEDDEVRSVILTGDEAGGRLP